MKISAQNKYLQQLINESTENLENIVTVSNNIYHNRLFEVRFEIPKNWHLISINKYKEIIQGQKINIPDEEKNKLIEEMAGVACYISKYSLDNDEKDGIISPVICFTIDAKDAFTKNLSLEDYIALLDNKVASSAIKGFKILEKGEPQKLNNVDSITYKTEYLFEHEELEEGVMVEMNVLNIDHGDVFLDFSMTQCKAQGEIAQNEFDSFVNSIRLG
ncbi:hypothetical protein [Aureispira anguillae]|uniref:Uncharacterized protein n=1 Tax=Aureispira anguillae TaxID=2864201 RepID=A0A916DR41_9BACT|nr:hypothetical protein [Aureispira anguillae]BDS11061.1 hypothetical protein AsAng_0017720 [Aureispira anguillae]